MIRVSLNHLSRLHDDWLYHLDIEADLIDPLHHFMQSMVSGQAKRIRGRT